MQREYVQVGSNNVRVYRVGKGVPVAFLPGLGAHVPMYELLLKSCPGFEFVAASVSGMNYLSAPPLTVQDCVELTAAVFDAIHFAPVANVGHSLGGLVALLDVWPVKKVVALQPVLPCLLSPDELVRNTLSMARELPSSIWVPYLVNFLRGIRQTYTLLEDLVSFDHSRVQPQAKCLVMHAEEDELFELTEEHEQYLSQFATVVRLAKMKHHCPITNYQEISAGVRGFLSGNVLGVPKRRSSPSSQEVL